MSHYFTNNENLRSNIKKVNASINGISFYFYTDNGVFSKGELDYGTKLLIKTFNFNSPHQKFLLDIGCGCGPIGIYSLKCGFKVDMTDINKRAIHLTKMALKEQNFQGNVFLSDAYEAIDNKYDYILSNPPIRVGKEKLYEIVMNARKYLNNNGELWIVVRKKQGAESLIKDMNNYYKEVKIEAKKKGFLIIKAKIC